MNIGKCSGCGRPMAAHRIAQIKKTDTPFDLTVEMSAVPFNVNDIIKTILGK